MKALHRIRWWTWAFKTVFQNQRRSARRAQIGGVALISVALPALAMQAQQPTAAPAGVVFAAVPHTPDFDQLAPEAAPGPVSPDAPVYDPGGAVYVAHSWVSQQHGCPNVPLPRAVNASYFPRIVIPAVNINVEIHQGDGSNPPDHVWVAWHYPGSADPGTPGNAYIYAHAHGSPQGSAPGLFWPLHYTSVCEAVYVYTSPTSAYRYQIVSVNKHWPANNTTPMRQTNDERVTLQTCNAWGDNDPKTIVVAMRVDAPPPPQTASSDTGTGGSSAGTTGSGSSGGSGSGGSGGGGGGSGSGGDPSPSPSPSPTPIVPCLVNCTHEAPEPWSRDPRAS